MKSAVRRARADDEDFRLDDEVPFVLDVQIRVTNLSEAESQRFDGNTIALTTDDGPLELVRTPSVSLSKLTSTDVSVSAPIDWGTDLTGLDIDLRGAAFVRGRLGLTGPTPPVDSAVSLGKIIERTLPGGVLCNATNFGTPRSGAVIVSTTSAAWRTTIPAPNDVSGAIDVLQSLRPRAGFSSISRSTVRNASRRTSSGAHSSSTSTGRSRRTDRSSMR